MGAVPGYSVSTFWQTTALLVTRRCESKRIFLIVYEGRASIIAELFPFGCRLIDKWEWRIRAGVFWIDLSPLFNKLKIVDTRKFSALSRTN